MDVDVVAADDAPSTSRPLASAGQDSQTPPVPLGVVNKLDDAEKRDQQWQNDATVNEWRTAPGEAGTLGRFGKCVLDALRPTVDDVVAVVTELRTVGYLFANFHAIRMVEEFERRKQAGRADADAALQPLDKTFFYRCLTLIWRPREAAGGNAGTGAKAAFSPLADSVARFQQTLERAGVDLQPPDMEYIGPFIHEAAGDLATATATYYKRELLRHLQQKAKLELGVGDTAASAAAATELKRKVEERAKQHAANKDAGIPSKRRGLGKQRRAALAKRKEAAANAAGSPAQSPQKPPPLRHIGRLFSLLPCRQGFEAVHITGTLTTLWAFLRRHEKLDRGGVARMTGLQLPTEKEL
ncbi:hypothetical protein F751_5432 [Auxenochlorella protothecoides]|uniref:Uncharacterized protein n=1 Tax=Auxenochlorella protothecoides TaxID=3075 RepID=A0A087SQ63_AUXPR|nr:hypothetical protein F751_5432 [Auxenochlorella protothecoides]KFM27867.1 hypothetical protein F751_5432 [Auxenochlorella protothecoides]